MEFINRPIVRFIKPHFIFNKVTKEVIIVPTIADANNPATTTIDLTVEDWKEADTIEELMVIFDSLGLIMPDQDEWDYPERIIRVIVKDSTLLSLLKDQPSLIGFVDSLKEYIVSRNGNQVIYLSELFLEHRMLFESINAKIESNV